ncbi:hypothetical protein TIFTF001_001263 [Ficus carica]|uniref:Uncharacterized protein n=1 Tax=Ficus carica TaxID=3494 RepID=A0AA87Z6D9_FICCA|nr:hypothetical protein TIFTF001_001263 [Ficus carica]
MNLRQDRKAESDKTFGMVKTKEKLESSEARRQRRKRNFLRFAES